MPSPGYVAHEHRLFDGRTVTIRPVRPDDADRMRRFLAAASEDARYKRFHKWVCAPSEDLVHFLTDIDHVRHLAFVCTVAGENGQEVVGEARSIGYPDGKHCEFGVLVEDAWRGTGIAGLLMDDLIRVARERGFTTMEGMVLRTNRPMQRFARSLGFEVVPTSGDLRTLRVRLDLALRQPRAEAGADARVAAGR